MFVLVRLVIQTTSNSWPINQVPLRRLTLRSTNKYFFFSNHFWLKEVLFPKSLLAQTSILSTNHTWLNLSIVSAPNHSWLTLFNYSFPKSLMDQLNILLICHFWLIQTQRFGWSKDHYLSSVKRVTSFNVYTNLVIITSLLIWTKHCSNKIFQVHKILTEFGTWKMFTLLFIFFFFKSFYIGLGIWLL